MANQDGKEPHPLPLTRQIFEDQKRWGTAPKPAKITSESTAGSFDQWLKDNPAPDLQALGCQHGGYDKISQQQWETFDQAMDQWQARRRNR
jgi:hypothetical protein